MSERIVLDMIPPDWNGMPYSVVSEMKHMLASMADHDTGIDSSTMNGQAHLWVTIGGVEYFIVVEKSSGRSKNNPLVPQEVSDD